MKFTLSRSSTGLLIALSILISTASPIRARQNSSLNAESLEAKVDRYVQPFVQMQDLSGAILISKNGKILYKKAFGFANVQKRALNTPQTRFRIGSLNKQMTAAAVLLLGEQQKLKTEDPVSRFLPDFPNGDNIRLHHLLTNTSGLPKYVPYKMVNNRQPSSAEMLRLIMSLEPEAKPGEKYGYSNAGFLLLALVVEKVSGKNFSHFLAENIFKPLGMRDSGVVFGDKTSAKLAQGYVTDIGTAIKPAPVVDVINYEVYSTVEDLDKWQNRLYGGKLLSPDSLVKMTTDYGNRYGYGLSVSKNLNRFGHDGVTSGFINFVTYFPDEKLSIVFSGNIESGALGELQKNLPAVTQGKVVETPRIREAAKKVATTAFQDYEGRYEVFPGFYLDVEFENEKLSLRGPMGAFIALTPLSENEFFYRHLYAKVTFVKDENRRNVGLEWTDTSGNKYLCKKIN